MLYLLGNGLRASLIPSINLSQMSEFSLVIASLGLTLQHIRPGLVASLTFVFAITSVLSTYLIGYNHEIQRALSRLLVEGWVSSSGADNRTIVAEQRTKVRRISRLLPRSELDSPRNRAAVHRE